MPIDSAFSWRCPVCGESLRVGNGQWTCVNQHSFDIAKEGYVNLLLAQHKRSKDPGDNKDMVNARRAFLAQDHYLPLANAISDILFNHFQQCANQTSTFSFADAGCGEGYYLEKVVQQVSSKFPENNKAALHGVGIDISKKAVQKAAKKQSANRQTKIHFAVASTYDLPILDESQQALIQIFAPAKPEEIARILDQNGIWIKVSPGRDHLYELKSMVYDSPEKHQVDNPMHAGFSLLSQQELQFELALSNTDVRQNLLMMTPFYWSISEQKKQTLLALLQSTQAHFVIEVLRKAL